jgi:hypothetical protein
MCAHIYQDCDYTLVDEAGGPVDQSLCEAECSSLFSTTEITCLDAATCSDTGFSCCWAGAPPPPPPTDNGSFGASCQCTATPTAGVQAGILCSGTEDGCAGVGFSGDLSCMAQRQTGSGTCTFRCTASQYGTQGSCPSGYTCFTSQYTDSSGAYFPVCFQN